MDGLSARKRARRRAVAALPRIRNAASKPLLANPVRPLPVFSSAVLRLQVLNLIEHQMTPALAAACRLLTAHPDQGSAPDPADSLPRTLDIRAGARHLLLL